MNRLPRAGRDLVVVQRDQDVLGVATINPVAVFVEHEHVDEMGPGIDLVQLGGIDRTTSTDHAIAAGGRHFKPDLVRIDRALREQVA